MSTTEGALLLLSEIDHQLDVLEGVSSDDDDDRIEEVEAFLHELRDRVVEGAVLA